MLHIRILWGWFRLALPLLWWQPPDGLSRTQWRLLGRAVDQDIADCRYGSRLPSVLLLAQDAQTRRAMEHLYWGMLRDPEDG